MNTNTNIDYLVRIIALFEHQQEDPLGVILSIILSLPENSVNYLSCIIKQRMSVAVIDKNLTRIDQYRSLLTGLIKQGFDFKKQSKDIPIDLFNKSEILYTILTEQELNFRY